MSSSPSSSGPKGVRDAAWEKIMADPEMQPGAQPMPFDGKRMFWGGFKPFVSTLEDAWRRSMPDVRRTGPPAKEQRNRGDPSGTS